MALESGIAQLVEEFIAAGRPSSREQNIDDRRAGYIASTTLAGETETRVQVEDIELNAMTFRVVSPLNATGKLPCIIYYHGGCFVSGGFATHKAVSFLQPLPRDCGAVPTCTRAHLPGRT